MNVHGCRAAAAFAMAAGLLAPRQYEVLECEGTTSSRDTLGGVEGNGTQRLVAHRAEGIAEVEGDRLSFPLHAAHTTNPVAVERMNR